MNKQLLTTTDRIVREDERKIITSISRTTAWSLEKKGLFPKRRRLYPESSNIGWLLSELNAWVKSRVTVNPHNGDQS